MAARLAVRTRTAEVAAARDRLRQAQAAVDSLLALAREDRGRRPELLDARRARDNAGIQLQVARKVAAAAWAERNQVLAAVAYHERELWKIGRYWGLGRYQTVITAYSVAVLSAGIKDFVDDYWDLSEMYIKMSHAKVSLLHFEDINKVVHDPVLVRGISSESRPLRGTWKGALGAFYNGVETGFEYDRVVGAGGRAALAYDDGALYGTFEIEHTLGGTFTGQVVPGDDGTFAGKVEGAAAGLAGKLYDGRFFGPAHENVAGAFELTRTTAEGYRGRWKGGFGAVKREEQ